MEIFQKSGATVSRAASTTTANVAISGVPGEGGQVRVAVGENSGANWCYIAFGETGVTATSADIPMIPGQSEVFTVGRGVTHLAAITDAGTCVVKATPGRGL